MVNPSRPQTKRMQQSAQDFQTIVWAIIRAENWLAGTLVPIENTGATFAQRLDAIGGWDYALDTGASLIGLAQRTEYQRQDDSFTVRVWRPSHRPTEWQHRYEGFATEGLLPYYMIHAVLAQKGGELLALSMVPTVALIQWVLDQTTGDPRHMHDCRVADCGMSKYVQENRRDYDDSVGHGTLYWRIPARDLPEVRSLPTRLFA